MSQVISMRVSNTCFKAWKYLEQHNVRAAAYMRDGGEQAIINKAKEFYKRKQAQQRFGNDVPEWVYN